MDFESFLSIVKEALCLSASIATVYQAVSSFGRPELIRDKNWLSNCRKFKRFVETHPDAKILIISTEKVTKYQYTVR